MELHHCKIGAVVECNKHNQQLQQHYHHPYHSHHQQHQMMTSKTMATMASTPSTTGVTTPTYITTCNIHCCYHQRDNLQQSQFPPTITTTTTATTSSFSSTSPASSSPLSSSFLSSAIGQGTTDDELKYLKIYQTSTLKQLDSTSKTMNMNTDVQPNDICRKTRHIPVDTRISTNLVIQLNKNSINQSTFETSPSPVRQRLSSVKNYNNKNSRTTITREYQRCYTDSSSDDQQGDKFSTNSMIDRFAKELPIRSLENLKGSFLVKKKNKVMTLAMMYLFVYILTSVTCCWAARQDGEYKKN